MTTPAEDSLYAALSEISELEELARIGLVLDSIPTESMRPVVAWALDYYFDSGRTQAPTRQLILDNWAEVIDDAGVELIDENAERDTIASAIENLQGLYADRMWQRFIKEAATLMATASPVEKVATLTLVTSDLFGVTNSLQDHSDMVEVQSGLQDSLRSYKQRSEAGHAITGLQLGFPAIDHHMGGVRKGELAVLGAGPKIGKSNLLLRVARSEWVARRPTVLYTLENSVEMTLDRLTCLVTGVSARRYQRGELTPEELERVEKFVAVDMPDMLTNLHIIAPPLGSRTPEMLVRQAMLLGAESIIVDQLTHVEHPDPGRKARHELFNENVHEFKALISTGRDRPSMLLAHQINREGVKSAEKLGHYEMWHLAESQGIERAADWVMGLYQDKVMREGRMAVFQIMAARREDLKNWNLYWDVDAGGADVRGERVFDS